MRMKKGRGVGGRGRTYGLDIEVCRVGELAGAGVEV